MFLPVHLKYCILSKARIALKVYVKRIRKGRIFHFSSKAGHAGLVHGLVALGQIGAMHHPSQPRLLSCLFIFHFRLPCVLRHQIVLCPFT